MITYKEEEMFTANEIKVPEFKQTMQQCRIHC